MLIGNGEVIVGIEHIGVERLLDIFDEVAFSESINVVAGEYFLTDAPVGLAVFDAIGIAVILVSLVVERDVDGGAA